MTTIALIGAGGIGTRHLQSLGLLSEPARIEVYDPARERVDAAIESADADHHQFVACDTMSALSEKVDVAIVATTASVRLAVLTELLECADVSHVILEKFLFQSQPDYARATELLAAAQTGAWVNTARRVWPSYQGLKARFADDERVSCRVSASKRLAIGTSAIHFLDVLAYVGGQTQFDLRADRLVLAADASRRAGYEEFLGAVYGTASDGGTFEYFADPVGQAPILIELTSPRRRCIIREPEAEAWYAGEDNRWRWEVIEFPTLLQSQLGHLVVEDLLRSGQCALTTFAESRILHEQMLAVLLDGYRRLTAIETDLCPIT